MTADAEVDYMRTYREFWQDIVETDGQLDLDKVARELHDFKGMLEEVPGIVSHVTNGLLSKPNYRAASVITVAEEVMEERIQTAIAEATGSPAKGAE